LLLALVLALGIVVDIAAQSDFRHSNARYYGESGNFYYKNYTTKEYKGSTQNWCPDDLTGKMVFANGDGVLIGSVPRPQHRNHWHVRAAPIAGY